MAVSSLHSSLHPPLPAQGRDTRHSDLLPLEEGNCAESEEYDIETHEYHKQKGNDTLYQ